jgi:hypothetical protein
MLKDSVDASSIGSREKVTSAMKKPLRPQRPGTVTVTVNAMNRCRAGIDLIVAGASFGGAAR